MLGGMARLPRAANARLFAAVAAGDLAAVQAAVAGGASMRARQNADGERQMLRAQISGGVEPLRVACGNGHLIVAQEPLHLACSKGHLGIAQWLHRAGAFVYGTNILGQTALHLACVHGHLDVAQWLCSAGLSLDATTSEGQTSLHHACSEGHLGTAQWLHNEGASLNATDTRGGTPLHQACYNGHLGITQWLCSSGADAILRTSAGDSPAQLLQRPGRTAQHDQQALRITLACLLRRVQAQGPPPCAPLPRCSRFH